LLILYCLIVFGSAVASGERFLGFRHTSATAHEMLFPFRCPPGRPTTFDGGWEREIKGEATFDTDMSSLCSTFCGFLSLASERGNRRGHVVVVVICVELQRPTKKWTDF
jgi:hypothetical protein